MEERHVDVVIVGAGISGINAAYRLRERCPELSFAILEGRERLGGTWDLFRYPGVRSDSDIYTLAFPFRPWTGSDSIVDGDRLWQYLAGTVRETGLDRHLVLNTRVTSADWSSATSRWRLSTESGVVYRARFVVFCTGYYDYEHPYDPGFSGVADFRGTVAHPQFWPEDLDYAGKRVVVIGSGATAVTVVPAMARTAGHVTMLQRTPTYVMARPRRDPVADALRRVLPRHTAHRWIRNKNTALQWAFYQACRRWPDAMRNLLVKGVAAGVGSQALAAQHFSPPYAPWDERLCIVPEGDLFTAVRDGSASVVTGKIDRFVAEGMGEWAHA